MKKFALAIAAVGLVVTSTGCNAVSSNESATCTVTDKDRTQNREGTSDARVYTTGGPDCGTFMVGDSITRGQFRSADLYGSIQLGKTYDFTYFGYRNGLLSLFPNIIEANEVKK